MVAINGNRRKEFLSILGRLFSELRKADKNFTTKNHTFRFVISEIRARKLAENTKCSSIFNDDEMRHFMSTFSVYLASSRRLEELQNKYKGRERSIEEAANAVGLKLPRVS